MTGREKWGVVAFLDALGTGEPRTPAEWEAVLDRRLKVIEDTKRFPQVWRQAFFDFDQARAGKTGKSFDVTAETIGFSDTILFAFGISPKPSPNDEALAIRAVFRYIVEWFDLAVITGELYRGALSVGTYYRDGTQILGPAVNVAGKSYNDADWAGIVLTEETGAKMTEPNVSEHPFSYCRWPVPLHPDGHGDVPVREMWTLCWPTRCEMVDGKPTPQEFWNKVEEIFNRTKRADVERKCGNTKLYYDEMWRRGLEERAKAEKAVKSMGGFP
jgi:hypothetical protein